jgi:hypothetical protein
VLHVTNGDAAVPVLQATGLPGAALPWRDVLHDGPVPAGVDDAELRAIRARFLAARYGVDEDAARVDMEERDARLARAVAEGDTIVLWFESDLYDMLQLAQVLDRLPPGIATLVIVGEQQFTGVAKLAPDVLRAIHDGGDGPGRRVAVDAPLIEAARAVWAALRNPDPAALNDLARATPPLPALGDAVHRHLEQFPHKGDALNRTERALLGAVNDGATTEIDAFFAQQRQEERPFMGDATAFGYLRELAAGPQPLLDNGNGKGLALTAHGAAVLDGSAAWEGRPERWLGGVRLPPGGSPWAWDPGAQKLV